MTRSPNYQRERGDRQETRILALIGAKPSPATAIAAALHISVSAVLIYTKRMRAERRIHVAGHEPCVKGRPAPLYAVGNMPDAEYISYRKPKLRDRKEVKRELALAALSEPRTADEVAALMFISSSQARVYIRELRDQRKAYITDWRAPDGRGDLAPVYVLGNRQDKPKPRQSRAARYRAEMSDPDRRDRILSQRRTRTATTRALASKNTWLSALGVA